ncbi:MAG: tetratricopeptide repeat protein [Candidatus Protistobacter heckmanni]|nr:tetratricopeptide repeat protein [Candidatus Protistobacter heckmanni]
MSEALQQALQHLQAGDPASALQRLDSVLSARPQLPDAQLPDAQLPDALLLRAIALQMLGRVDEALQAYDRLVALQSGNAMGWSNMGVLLAGQRRHGEALDAFDKALALAPDYLDALNNRGNVLHRLNRFEAAVVDFDRVLAQQPGYARAWNNRGNALKELHRFDEAMRDYVQAAALDPAYATQHWNISLLALLRGDFAQGWDKYEWRWQWEDFSSPRRDFPQPQWRAGQPLEGKTILLHAEQGIGDTIQFVRYAPMLKALGGRVVLEVQPALKALLDGMPGADLVLTQGQALPAFDLHCPILSLPLAFGTGPSDIPAPASYLSAPAARRAHWRKKAAALLGGEGAPRVGLVWSGNPNHSNDHNRSIPPALLARALEAAPGAELISLHKELRAEEAAWLRANPRIRFVGAELNDMADTAALIEQLDLVISVDTSVAHLAGALGKPTWLLVPHLPDWRWQLGREDSPWYPAMRLFRQDVARDWSTVLGRVA